MLSVVIKNGKLYEIVKKRKLLTIQETDQEDGKKINEYVDNLIIENEAENFFKLFEKTFCEETDETEFDSEDRVVNDLVNKIVLKIKEKLISEKVKNRTGLNLLRLLLGFIEQILKKEKAMARTRAVPRWRPANINFDQRRVAAAKEIANRRGNGIENIKVKILLPQGKNVEFKHRWNVVRRMRVRRRAIFPGRVRNVRYGRNWN